MMCVTTLKALKMERNRLSPKICLILCIEYQWKTVIVGKEPMSLNHVYQSENPPHLRISFGLCYMNKEEFSLH